MKKCLLLIALLVLSKWNMLCAQTLFNAPDTVCIHQPVTLTSNIFNQTSYYWGFCTGYLLNTPTGVNLGSNFGFHLPANIDIVYDSGSYYGFVVNSGTTEFLRLNFGNSLSNIPTVTNFGNLTNGLPKNPTSLFIVQDTAAHNWFVFVSGGWTTATSTLGRVDFGRHLSNPHPNVANFGNFGNVLSGPKGIFIAQDANKYWWGYLVNHNNSRLIHLDFGMNISNTPHMTDMGDVFATLNGPTDMAGTYYNGNWYLFVTNESNSTLSRINLGTTLDTVSPGGTILGNYLFRINAPSSISINKDCGNTFAYVTDSTTSQLVAIQMPDVSNAATYSAVDYSTVGGTLHFPAGISSILRDHDNLYGFVVNAQDSSLTRIDFQPCTRATIPSFTDVAPPVYSYDTPGVYNVYYVINQGLPTMQVECKSITVLAYPPIYMTSDTTICEGDTIRVHVISSQADSIRWTSVYAIDTTNQYINYVRLYPDYSTVYPVILYYPDGCIVDTALKVHVSRVKADAGPDRWIHDGASTIIGGVNTTLNDVFAGNYYAYYWTPYQFLSDSLSPNPVANPPYDYTYYLTVVELNDGLQCMSKDTMVVHVDCGDIYLPNAFSPNSNNSATNQFRILNVGISQLSYLRVYNRWGALVFETSDPTQGWDGIYNGKPAPPDVYVWVADGFCASHGIEKEYKKKGNVTLLR